jgi:hypothetical protein
MEEEGATSATDAQTEGVSTDKESRLGREWQPRKNPKKEAQKRAIEHLASTPESLLTHVVFDLAFQHTMDEGALRSLAQQIMLCQHANLLAFPPFSETSV